MKKYMVIGFLFAVWGVAEAFVDPWRILGVAASAAALTCVMLIRKPVIGLLAAAAFLLGVVWFFPDISLRFMPVSLLLTASRTAAAAPGKNKKHAESRRDGVYTAVLAAVLVSLGKLVHDISFFTRNRAKFAVSQLDFMLFGAAACVALLTVYAFARRASLGKLWPVIWIGAFIGVGCAAAGYVLNAGLYDVFASAFPWLVFLAAGEENPVSAEAFGLLTRKLSGRAAAEA